MEEFEDGLKIPGGQKLRGAKIDSRGDHRIAMAFAVAGSACRGRNRNPGADAAVISFPRIFRRAGKHPGTVVVRALIARHSAGPHRPKKGVMLRLAKHLARSEYAL